MKKVIFFLLLLSMVLPMTILLTAQGVKDPIDYEIWVRLDPSKKMLQGRETISWTNTSRDAIPDFWFHLYWNAFKNEKSVLMSEARRE
ncbi:MAG: hypothetical protein MUP71_09590, partial [Candidatus Aminicenantes bacterium]|nr:hypothetical protein [Candidatus Aminicenantes bacterium]